MDKFWIFILVLFFATKLFEKAKSVELEETPPKIFDEIFGEGWWDNGKADEWRKLTLEHNFHHQINRQNTQIGQIEPNSTDQLGQIEPNSTDQLGQIEPNSTDQLGQIEPNSTDQLGQIEPNSIDQLGQIEPNSTDQLGQIEPNSIDQNPPLTESFNAKNGEDQNEITSNAEDERKRKIICKFHAIKDEFKQKRKYSKKEWNQIDDKIAKYLKVNSTKIYQWKKEFGLSQKRHNFGNEKEERKHLIKKFEQKKAELQRGGFKNFQNELDKTVAKELGLSFATIYNWKRKLGQTTLKHKHSHSEQKELMNRYYEIKDKTPKLRDEEIAKMLKIGSATLIRWKRQFKRQQFYPNVVDELFVEDRGTYS